jgi:LysR family transcriptional regulator of gallate degradation
MEWDLKPLMHLRSIAQHGSFSRAAAEMRMSQPALSNSIKTFEKRLGTQLLTRGRYGARLTELGEVLTRRAELLHIQISRAEEDIKHHLLAKDGPLVIGVTPVAAAELVPRALGELRASTPNVCVSMLEMVFSEAMPALLNGQVDVVIGPLGVYPKVQGIEEEQLATDPFTIIVPPGHTLRSRRSVSLRQLQDAPWVLPNDQSAFHRQLEGLFVVAGLGWPVGAIQTNSMAAMKAMVIYGNGIAIMPRQLVGLETRAGVLHCITLAEAGASRALGMSWAKERKLSPVAEDFIRILRRCASEARTLKGKPKARSAVHIV